MRLDEKKNLKRQKLKSKLTLLDFLHSFLPYLPVFFLNNREEFDLKRKNALDPMNAMKRYVNAKRKVEGKLPEVTPPAKKLKAIEFVKTESDVKPKAKPEMTSSSSESESEQVR